MKVIFLFLILISAFSHTVGQNIFVDEDFSDWNTINVIQDVAGDDPTILPGFNQIQIHNNDKYLFINIKFNKEVLLQGNHDISIFIDTDMNANTGFKYNGIGAEINYNFGEGNGYLYRNNQFYFARHDELGLLCLPSVTSLQFEILLSRSISVNGLSHTYGNDIKVVIADDRLNGDRIPNTNEGITYKMNTDVLNEVKSFSYSKDSDLMRIMSLNCRRDDLFNPGTSSAQKRVIQAIDADIIAFQEIYDHSAEDVAALLNDILPLPNNTKWFAAKASGDIILASRYSIIDFDNIDGNGIFYVKKGEQPLGIINAHLPCCENDADRQAEVDNIVSTIRRFKAGTFSSVKLPLNTPYIIVGDMNFVGDRQQPESFRTGNIINESQYGNDIRPDWDNTDLVDAKPYVSGLPAAFTWFSPGNSFMPGRLDYMFYSDSKMVLKNSFILRSESLSQDALIDLNLDSKDSSTGTDHLPIVCDFSFDVTSHIAEIEPHISIYPNPVNDKLLVDVNVDISEIIVYNLYGLQIINSKLNTDNYIDVSGLGNGTYFMKIKVLGNKVFFRKFIVMSSM